MSIQFTKHRENAGRTEFTLEIGSLVGDGGECGVNASGLRHRSFVLRHGGIASLVRLQTEFDERLLNNRQRAEIKIYLLHFCGRGVGSVLRVFSALTQ
jgi:hypothetical protein